MKRPDVLDNFTFKTLLDQFMEKIERKMGFVVPAEFLVGPEAFSQWIESKQLFEPITVLNQEGGFFVFNILPQLGDDTLIRVLVNRGTGVITFEEVIPLGLNMSSEKISTLSNQSQVGSPWDF